MTNIAPQRIKPKQTLPSLSGWNSIEINRERCISHCCSDYDNSALVNKDEELFSKIIEIRNEKTKLQLKLVKLESDLTEAKLEESKISGLLIEQRTKLADFKLEQTKEMNDIINDFNKELKDLSNLIQEENNISIESYKKQREDDILLIQTQFNERDTVYQTLLEKQKESLNEYRNFLIKKNDDYLKNLEKEKDNAIDILSDKITERNFEIISEINKLNNSNEDIISKTKEGYNKKIKELTNAYNQKMTLINNQKKIIQEEYSSLEKNLKAEVDIARKAKEDMQKFYDKEIVTIKKKIDENDRLLLEILDEMDKEFQKRKTIILKGANFDKEKIISLVDGKIESYVDMYERKKKTASLDFAQRKKELIDNYNTKLKNAKENISNNINTIQEEKAILYSELNDINNKYKKFSEDSINELDDLSKLYQVNVDKYNLEYNLQKEIFDKELQDEMDKLEKERINTIKKHSEEVNELLKEFEKKFIKEEQAFFSTSNKKRLELAKLVKELDEKSTKIIMDKQKNISQYILKLKNNYDNILSEYEKEREELKIKLENAELDVVTSAEDYNKIVNTNTGIVKIIQENENISNYILYFFGLSGIVLLILILTKKK